eukprot:16428837-Heterocapsa_arctica.AAC.1
MPGVPGGDEQRAVCPDLSPYGGELPPSGQGHELRTVCPDLSSYGGELPPSRQGQLPGQVRRVPVQEAPAAFLRAFLVGRAGQRQGSWTTGGAGLR